MIRNLKVINFNGKVAVCNSSKKYKRSQIRVNDMIKKKCTFFFKNFFSFLSFFAAHLSLLDCLVSDIRNHFYQYFYKVPIKRTG